MAAPPYQKLFWGSYHKHTSHLMHAREHGAYLLLIGALWNNEGRLPCDDDTLASYAKLSLKDWAAVKPKLMPLFHINRGKLTQLRVTEDLAKYRDTSGKRKVAGKTGGEASSGKRKVNGQAIATGLPTKPEPESEPEKKEPPETPSVSTPKGAKRKPTAKASRRAPEGWSPSDRTVELLTAEGYSPGDLERALTRMRDHEFRTARSDWNATFRNWVRPDPRHAKRPHPIDAKQSAREANYARSLAGADIAAGQRWKP